LPLPLGPTLHQKRLARTLKELRLATGRTIGDISTQLGWSPRKITRWETGEMTKPVIKEIEQLLHAYGADGATLDAVLTLATEARRTPWWRQPPYLDALTPSYDHHIDRESEAAELRTWEPHLIPGLLQTTDYARALIEASPNPPRDPASDQRILLRAERQRQLMHQPRNLKTLWAIFDEAAITRQVGGPEVMHAQLTHLIRLAQLPHVVLQVLPFTTGATPATEPFTIFSSSNPLDLETVHVELLGPGDIWHEDPQVVAMYQDLFTASIAASASAADSLELIRARRDDLRKAT
jgi:transcriptional regulator with XRE-family HTH domain